MAKRKQTVQESESDGNIESCTHKKQKRRKNNTKVSKELVSVPLKETESDEVDSESGAKELEYNSEYIEAQDEHSEKSSENNAGTDDDECGEHSDDDSGDEQNSRRKRMKAKDDPTKEARTIFVGNVPISVTPKKLKRAFKQYGQIESMRIRGVIPGKPTIAPKVAAIKKGDLSDKHRNSSIAYIVFKQEADCKSALSMNGYLLDGHHLRVSKCTETQYPPSLSVFVGNLPAKVKEEDLWNFFGKESNIEAVRIVRDKETGRGKGVAFVMFQSNDNVALALEKNNLEMNGRKIRVQRCQSKSRERMKGERNTHNRSKFRRKFHSKSGVFANKAAKPKLKKRRKMKKALAKQQHIVEVLNKS